MTKEELTEERDKVYNKARSLDYLYQKEQRKIKSKVLADIPSEIRELENKKQRLKIEFLDKRRKISNQIIIKRKNRRKLTKKAYEKSDELQRLKQEKKEKWDEYYRLSKELWIIEEKAK